jgi:hypothetical protein
VDEFLKIKEVPSPSPDMVREKELFAGEKI